MFPVSSVLSQDEVITEPYPASWAFDVESGDFVRDGGGRVCYSNGYEAWKLWCCKTIATQRGSHLAYSNAVGVETDSALAEPDRASVVSALERTITEALLADPLGRTLRVYDFTFSLYGEEGTASCTVLGKSGDTASITVKML